MTDTSDKPHTTNAPAEAGWRQIFDRKMMVCMSLGFSSGLPLFILLHLVTAWLKSEQVDLKAIGLIGVFGFCYTWKFAWAPMMDRYALPFLGRRRGWILLTQLLLFMIIAALGQISPQHDILLVSAFYAALAFVSASQDIVIDAYKREILEDNQQALGNALAVNCYKLSALVPGSLALILSDHFSWQTVFLVTALFMLPGIVTTLLMKEPRLYGSPPKNIREAVVMPFKEFINRKGVREAALILLFIMMYNTGNAMTTALQTPFFMELGFSRSAIGVIAKSTGLWAGIAGGLIGGLVLIKIGINRGLWIFGFFQASAILGFAALAKVGENLWMLGAVMALDYFAVGMAVAAFTAYIATTTDPRYTATQFALFTSLMAIPRTISTAASGYIVAVTGWFGFFIICFLLAIPGMLLLLKVAPWNGQRTKFN